MPPPRSLLAALVVLAAFVLLPAAGAQAAVGVNVSPGWGGTVDGRDI